MTYDSLQENPLFGTKERVLLFPFPEIFYCNRSHITPNEVSRMMTIITGARKRIITT